MVTLARRNVTASVGVKTDYREGNGMSQMATTGSITAASDQLTVADVMDFRVGDWVIVELGGEAGAGAWGTVGVGGSYPELSYADAATRDADTGQTVNELCYLEDTKICYYWSGTAWTEVPASKYYSRKVTPKALWAEITNIAGSVLTLSKTASVSSTNANVYFDNWGVINEMIEAPDLTINLPEGTFYISDHLYFANRDNTVIRGAGKTATILKSPLGASHAGLTFNSSDGCTVKDLTLRCNWLNNGYGWRYADGRTSLAYSTSGVGGGSVEGLYPPSDSEYGGGILFNDSDNGIVRRVRVYNASQNAVAASASTNFWAYDCNVYTDDPVPVYVQWQYNHATSTGGLVRCNINNAYANASYEVFASSGGVSWTDCTGVNALCSLNSAENVTITNMHLTLEQDKRAGAGGVIGVAANQPIINVNSNTGESGDLPHKIYNLTIIANRFQSSGERPPAISINALTAPVELYGTYDTDFVTPKGLIQQNDPAVFGTFDGIGINCNAPDGVIVQGMRFRGEAPEIPARRQIYAYNPGTITITDCVLDDGVDGSSTYVETGTLTNAEFDALHPGLP
jgi:ribosome modulation factor